MKIYTKDDELPEDIAEDSDERIPEEEVAPDDEPEEDDEDESA